MEPLSTTAADFGSGSSAPVNGRQHVESHALPQSAVNGHTVYGSQAAASQAVRQRSDLRANGKSHNTAGLPEGGTLVVCPTAVLNQWARELENKVAPPAGKHSATCQYHGLKPSDLAA